MATPDSVAPFLQSTNFLRAWSPCEGRRCELEGVALSLDRAPPPLPRTASASTAPLATPKVIPKASASDPYLNTVLAVAKVVSSVGRAVHAIQNPPPVAPKPRIVARKLPPAPPAPQVPPFDIQDIPGAMRQLGMPMSAKLMERWFNGQLNYSLTDADEKSGNRSERIALSTEHVRYDFDHHEVGARVHASEERV